MKSHKQIALGIFILVVTLFSFSFSTAFDSGWINLRDNGISVACGGDFPACTNSNLGVDWFKEISNVDEKGYGLICGGIPEVERRDCLLHHNAAVGQVVSVPSFGSYYVILGTWYGYTSASTNEKMKVGVTKDWTARSSYQNVKDLGSGNKKCVLRNPVYIGNAKTKLWIQGTDGSVNPFVYRIASCIPQGVVDNGLVYCDDGTPAVANCCVPVNGGWSTTSYGAWSACVNNLSTRMLTETCNNPAPNSCGKDCTTSVGWARSGNTQTKLQTTACEPVCVPTPEVCDGRDNDCDGDIDEDLNCNPECTQNSQCAHLNINSSNYCYSDDVYKNSTIFSCLSNSCQADPFSLIKVQECGVDSHEVSANYCLGNNVTRNVTDIDRGCSSSSCFATGQPVVETVQTCPNGCTNGACNPTPIAPIVTIISPENIVYRTFTIPLNVIADQIINVWNYAINNGTFAPFVPNTTMIFNSTGVYRLDVTGMNSNGTGIDFVYFTIDLSHVGD